VENQFLTDEAVEHLGAVHLVQRSQILLLVSTLALGYLLAEV
jgi:hypothetical protein